jgi:hypothetical protein
MAYLSGARTLVMNDMDLLLREVNENLIHLKDQLKEARHERDQARECARQWCPNLSAELLAQYPWLKR